MAKTATRQVSIFINGKEVENSIKAIAAEQKKANNELAKMIIGSEEYVAKAEEIKRLNSIITEHRQGLNSVKQGWDLTRVGMDKFIGLAAGAFTVDAVIGYGKELFNTAVQMEAMTKKAKIVFGEALPGVTEEAKKSATAMGFTTAEYIAQAAAIQDILVPMGFQRKQAAAISTQLVNLSGALSEWTGGQVTATQVSNILSSALTGEREQLKQLGIVLQQADIDARLAEKGQSKLEGTLRQQAEAAATLELILEKSQDAQLSYAENADTMARKSAELSARFDEVKERLANALVPVFEAFVTVMEDAGDGFSNFIGLLEDPTWGDAFKRFLTPFLGIGGGSILTRIFGTKKEVSAVKTEVDKLVEDTDALLLKYGVDKNGPPKEDKEGPKAAEAARKAAEAAAKKRLQEAEQLSKELEGLVKRTTDARLDLLAKQQDDELAISIRGIEKRYDAEIAKAKELEKKGVTEATAQRLILEQLKADEIGLVSDQFYASEYDKLVKSEKEKQDAELKAYDETLQFLDAKRDERNQFELEIKDFERAGLLTDRENELLELETHYQTLLSYAQKNGIDTVELTKSFEAQKTEIAKQQGQEREDFEKQLIENFATLQIDRANAVAQGAAILGSFFEETSTLGKAFFLVEKAAAAVSVVLSLQKEKAAIYAAARLGTIFDPTGAAALALATPQIISANIRAGINLGVIAASALKPFIKQKFTGGYTQVTGATDGRQYNPSVIGTPNTGLLPNHPVLFRSNADGQPVLASERGSEYFVASKDLRNPAVANYVRLIDDIVTSSGARVRQFADGGLNQATAAPAPNAAPDNAMMREMAALMAQQNQLLTYLISNGVVAVVPDGTVIGINDRLKKLQQISGNYY